MPSSVCAPACVSGCVDACVRNLSQAEDLQQRTHEQVDAAVQRMNEEKEQQQQQRAEGREDK